MRKLSLLILALCLLAAGCQLAKPEAQAMGDPAGIWMELHKEGDALIEGYAPAIDFESAAGGLGLIMSEKGIGEDGQPYTAFGSKVSPQFLDRGFGSHTNWDMQSETETRLKESFTATLYLDRNAGARPDELWIWYIYADANGSLYAGPERNDVIYPRMYELNDGESLTSTLSYKTSGTGGKEKEDSYTFVIKGLGRLEQVQILEFDGDFNRLSTVSLEIEDGDEYQARPDTAYVVVEETYVTDGREKKEQAIYAAANAIDYDGQMAQYHACKYMGPHGLALPRSLKILF